jgi:hypothetical protein
MKIIIFWIRKMILLAVLICTSLTGYSQIDILRDTRTYSFVNHKNSLPGKDTLFDGVWKGIAIIIYPYQKVKMDFFVIAGDKIILTDTSRLHVRYSQIASTGCFNFSTKDEYETLILYNQDQGHYIQANLADSNGPEAMIEFGNTKIKITTTSIPVKPDTLNKQFVRFIHLNPPLPDVSHLTISVGKIPPIDVSEDNEPIEHLYEERILTNATTCQAIKNFINENQNLLQTDTHGLNYNTIQGSFKIIIDYQKTYYLKYDKVDVFFKLIITYCELHHLDPKIISRFKTGLL